MQVKATTQKGCSRRLAQASYLPSIFHRPASSTLHYSTTWPRRGLRRHPTPTFAFAVDMEGAEATAVALAAAATAATSSMASEPLVQATGVPLLEHLMQCSLKEAMVRGLRVMLLTTIGALAGEVLLRYLDWKTKQPHGGAKAGLLSPQQDARGRLRALPLLLSSLIRQARRMLPVAAVAYLATVVCALLQVAAGQKQDALVHFLGSHASNILRAVLQHLTQFLEDAAEEVLILLCVFTALDINQRVVDHASHSMLTDQDVTNDDAVGLVVALGKMASWGIWGAAAFVTLANYGINLRPLLASLGASSLVLGIAAQSLLKNLASGITLYTCRPFSVGDHIQLITVEGDQVVEGVVVALQPTRTVIQGEKDGGSTFYVNNGDLEGMIVENRTKKPVPIANPPAPTTPHALGQASTASTNTSQHPGASFFGQKLWPESTVVV